MFYDGVSLKPDVSASTMNRPKRKILIVLGGAILAGMALYLLFGSHNEAPTTIKGGKAGPQSHLMVTPSSKEAKSGQRGGGVSKKATAASKTRQVEADKAQRLRLGVRDEDVQKRPATDQATALKRWEDRLVLYYDEGAKERVKTSPVTVEEQEEVLELFRDLSPEAQNEQIHHAMNLLPDETVEVVYGILFDTSQPPEVIGVIFHDLLNRDEAIKNPVMEEIVKDKSHPMYVESARILDIVRPTASQ